MDLSIGIRGVITVTISQNHNSLVISQLFVMLKRVSLWSLTNRIRPALVQGTRCHQTPTTLEVGSRCILPGI